MRTTRLGRALIYLISVWVLYAQHIALTHVFAHLHSVAAGAQQVAIAAEPERPHDAAGAGLCAFDASLCQLLLAAPREDLGHPRLATRPVTTLAGASTHIAFARLHPPSRGPPALL